MRRIFHIFISVMLSLLIAGKGYGQTAVWQIKPTENTNIQRVTQNLFLVTKNLKMGLVDVEGKIVAPLIYDNLGKFYEQIALMTSYDDKGELIVGCLHDNGQYTQFTRRYYTLAGQAFYSDGLLSVADASGNKGYIDVKGNPVLGFDGSYDRIKPFCEGYAAVSKNKHWKLIDKEGQNVRFQFKKVVEVYGVTNPCNGIVYIWDVNGKYYTYDTKNKGLCVSAKKPKDRTTFDFLYRLKAISGVTSDVPFTDSSYRGAKGASPYLVNSYYGYKEGDYFVLPCQFIEASQFEDNLAIVNKNGKTGVVRYLSENKFDVTPVPSEMSLSKDGSPAKFQFVTKTPQAWSQNNLTFEVLSPEGKTLKISRGLGKYDFEYTPTHEGYCIFLVKIIGDDLLLYEGELTYNIKMSSQHTKEETRKCPKCKKNRLLSEFEDGEEYCKKCSKPSSEPNSKKCSKCHKMKSLSEFANGGKICNKCIHGDDEPKMRKCSNCKKNRPITSFVEGDSRCEKCRPSKEIKCSSCKKERPVSWFSKGDSRCKKCKDIKL